MPSVVGGAVRPAFAAQTVQATVTRVVDGDTVRAEDAHGTKLRIRLLGIDAPELAHPRKRACCGTLVGYGGYLRVGFPQG